MTTLPDREYAALARGVIRLERVFSTATTYLRLGSPYMSSDGDDGKMSILTDIVSMKVQLDRGVFRGMTRSSPVNERCIYHGAMACGHCTRYACPLLSIGHACHHDGPQKVMEKLGPASSGHSFVRRPIVPFVALSRSGPRP